MKIEKKDFKKEEQWLLKEKYFGKPNKQFYKDVKRLEKGEPVDFVIGWKEFLGCEIDLSKKTLIPRPETEFWVLRVIDEIKKYKIKKIKCLDIFAGSGCIGVAVLANVPGLLPASTRGARRREAGATVDFADNDKRCLAQIKINLKNNSIKRGRYNVIKSDVFAKIKDRYDFILANPPYIPTTRKSKIQKSVLKYEPRQALFGGKDGMQYIKKFLSRAKNHLNTNGKIYMEFDYIQKKGIEKLLKQYGYNSWQFFKDQYGKYRWVVVS